VALELRPRDPSGRRVDCHPLRFDVRGDGWQAKVKGGAPYRWPREGLQARGEVAGVEVPCISAELQVRWHQYPAFDDVDWQDVQLLCDGFGLVSARGLPSETGLRRREANEPLE
jgi:lincosamide nucleotidyltransferase A/C/D/E